MRPNAGAVVLFLGQLSLSQAAVRRRHGMLDKVLGVRGGEGVEKRQDAGQATVTLIQTVTVGGADAGGIVANNTVTVTVTADVGATTVTVCPPGAALGASQPDSAAAPPGAGAAVSPPGAAVPGALDVPTGGIGVQIIAIPTELRTPSKVVAGAPAPTAAPVAPPAVQNPAASLAPLPGAPDLASSLTPLPVASDVASSLAPLPGLPDASLAPLPGFAPSSSLAALPGLASSLAPLPGLASSSLASLQPLQPLPTATTPGGVPPVAAPAVGLDSTLALPLPGGAIATPVANPGGDFGGSAGLTPIPGGEAPPAAAQPAIDPTVTVSPDVAAGAQVNIDLSGVVLNSQLNLGNLVQASPLPAPV